MTILLFANGDLNEIDWIRPCLAESTAVIAADGGSRHLWRLGWLPDLIVGDMDSLPREVRSWLEEGNVPFHQVPEEKDETDLELALLHAVNIYKEDIRIIAALGGRLDQTLANILLLAHPAFAGIKIELLTAHERAWLVTSETEIHGEIGDTVSFIPLGGDVSVESTSGLKWQLENEKLAFGPARGVSNTLTASAASISLKSGSLLCIHMSLFWKR